MPIYTLDFGPGATGTPAFTVFRDPVTQTNHIADAPALSGVTDGYVDFLWTSGVIIHFRAELGGTFITGELNPVEVLPTGEGSVRIDHNYSGTDSFRILDDDTFLPMDNAFIYIYLTEDYDAGRTNKTQYLKAWTTTNMDGRWSTPLYLDPGEYTILVIKARARPKTRLLVVT